MAAAMLHDVVEDTATGVEEVRQRFGPEVADLVAAMTEDASIAGYEERKAEHRRRVRGAGRSVAAIYTGDKLASVRRRARDGREIPDAKLAHYRRTLEELERAYPDLALLGELRGALDGLTDR